MNKPDWRKIAAGVAIAVAVAYMGRGLETTTVQEVPTVKPIPPCIFTMLDSRNVDYQKVYPELGALGGWAKFYWDDMNPQRGQYDWTTPDAYLRAAAAMTVTLEDGSIIPKPVGLCFATWEMLTTSSRIGVNRTPVWVGNYVQLSSCYDPDGAGGCLPFCTPRWSEPVWQGFFDDFIMEAGKRYNNNPEFANLAFMLISTGADDETVERKDNYGCKYYSGNTFSFDKWVERIMGTYSRAFPNLSCFIQTTVHGSVVLADLARTFPSQSVGLKFNGATMDVENAEVRRDGVLVGGLLGYGVLNDGVLPSGFEPKHGEDEKGIYRMIMESLSAKPTMWDIQLPNIITAGKTKAVFGVDVLGILRRYLGKTSIDAPAAWVMLRGTGKKDDCWTPSGASYLQCNGPDKDDISYYMDRVDAPGARPVLLIAEKLTQIPIAARNHPFGWQSARRTDRASGNTAMAFKLDNRFIASSWVVTATVVANGDEIGLEYLSVSGVTETIWQVVGGTVGEWTSVSWAVVSPLREFRIISKSKDFIAHMVMAERFGVIGPTPVQPNTPTNTASAPTSTLTRTPTRTPTVAGKPLCSSCAVGGEPCAPGLICYKGFDGRYRCVDALSPNGSSTNCINQVGTPSPVATPTRTATGTPTRTATVAPTIDCCQRLEATVVALQATVEALTTSVTGYATWYAPTGSPTRLGMAYDGTSMTMAVPWQWWEQYRGRMATVTSMATGKSVDVMINDSGLLLEAGTFGGDYIIADLSPAAFEAIGHRLSEGRVMVLVDIR